MKLEEIGFYTLSDRRACESSETSDIMRAELILTDRCNLSCLYCKGLKKELQGSLSLPAIQDTLRLWIDNGLKNIRFSGGEPTLHRDLKKAVKACLRLGVERIAISTNGTAEMQYYSDLVWAGVNDFSISLDGGCCAIADKMAGGINGAFGSASKAIAELSKITYVTVGVVFNEENVMQAKETITYIDSLNPSDIRIISSAQYDRAVSQLVDLPEEILLKYPILRYRINNMKAGRNVRGISKKDCHKCYLVLDDVASAGGLDFPCIIYMREGGKPICESNEGFRQDRLSWFYNHNSFEDDICRRNCLDVCVDYNNKAQMARGEK